MICHRLNFLTTGTLMQEVFCSQFLERRGWVWSKTSEIPQVVANSIGCSWKSSEKVHQHWTCTEALTKTSSLQARFLNEKRRFVRLKPGKLDRGFSKTLTFDWTKCARSCSLPYFLPPLAWFNNHCVWHVSSPAILGSLWLRQLRPKNGCPPVKLGEQMNLWSTVFSAFLWGASTTSFDR